MGKNAQKSSQAPAVEPVANGEGERLLSGQTEKIWQEENNPDQTARYSKKRQENSVPMRLQLKIKNNNTIQK